MAKPQMARKVRRFYQSSHIRTDRSSYSYSTGWPINAVEMLDTSIDRALRVCGHDL
jgi:hypothetical protein